jgi:hypothetical protein
MHFMHTRKLMDSKHRFPEVFLIVGALIGLCAYVSFCSRDAEASDILYPSVSKFENAKFDSAPFNTFDVDVENDEIEIKVDKSKSFIVMPFSEPVEIRALSFFWKTAGQFKVISKAMEQSNEGNDNRLAVGLLLAGRRTLWESIFPPEWMDVIDQRVHADYNEMILFNVGSKTPPGELWDDPEFKHVSHISLADEQTFIPGNWKGSSVVLSEPYKVVGIVLFADGDQTDSKFKSTIKELAIAQ